MKSLTRDPLRDAIIGAAKQASYEASYDGSYEQGEVAPMRATKRIGSYENTKEEGLC